MDADSQSLNMHWLKFKHGYAGVKRNLCKRKFKLSYMQCDDGYIPWTSWRGLGFWVRSGTLHTFGLVVVAGWSSWRWPFLPPHFLGCGFWFDLFLFRFQKFLTLDSSSRISIVVKLDLLHLLLNPLTFYILNEGFNRWDGRLLWLFLGFLLPVDCFDLRTLFDLRLEGERLLQTIDVELNFSSSHINTCICGAQERPP